MLPGLATAALVLSALVWQLSRPHLTAAFTRVHARVRERGIFSAPGADRTHELDCDPGRERRAEQRARELLRSCVNEHEWAMYRDLGFLRVFSRSGERYAYLIYAHKPIVAYVPQTSVLLGEYCVAFPDRSRPAEAGGHSPSARIPRSASIPVSTEAGGHSPSAHIPVSTEAGGHSPSAHIPVSTEAGGHSPSAHIPVSTEAGRHSPSAHIPVSASSARLPASDDVLAKWMALIADERRLIAEANMHLPGRQVDPEQVRRDLARLAGWEREHDRVPAAEPAGGPEHAIAAGAQTQAVPAPAARGGRAAWGSDNVRAA